MAYSHNPDMYRWKRFTKTKTTTNKVQLNDRDIDQWMKRVEMASDIAVKEVFPLKKSHSGINSQILTLQSTEQLLIHDEAYCEAQALLSDWMNSKLRLELETDVEDMIGSNKNDVVALAPAQPVCLNYSNFDDLYSLLAEEQESSAINSVLQDLMEREVVDSGTAEDLALDSEERDRKKRRDPSLTMEARHRQVRENRAQRDAERKKLQKEREVLRQAREEAQRREQEVERQRRQEERRQDEMLQQEMVRLRRDMEGRRNLNQLAWQMERVDRQKVLQPAPCSSLMAPKQKQAQRTQPHGPQRADNRAQILVLQCLQRHFSGWYSVLLERRVRMGKAAALCDWKRELRVWRAWRGLVWAGRKKREAARTEEELRTQNRHCQVAMENDRKRLLRRCLNDWQLWCRAESERRELLAQQDETRRKMAALINAVASGKLKATEAPTPESIVAMPKTDQSETAELKSQLATAPVGPAPSSVCQGEEQLGVVTTPTVPWQVTRRHAALSASELKRAQQTGEKGRDGTAPPRAPCAALRGGRFEHRQARQQQTIAQQRRLLQEQQEQIAHLQEEQRMMGLKQEAQMAQLAFTAAPGPRGTMSDPKESRTGTVSERNNGSSSPSRKPAVRLRQPCASVMAMEERARQRAERRREVENMKIKKEEERLAQLKAAEEAKQREEKEEERRVAERRRQEKRQERERELEKVRKLEREEQLNNKAQAHYRITLLLRRGLAPWKRLVVMSQTDNQLARDHHRLSLLKWCLVSWQQVAGESLAQKRACADQLNQHMLLRWSLGNWKRLKDLRVILEERAEQFWRTRTLRRALIGLLDHVTQERLAQWDKEQQAQDHSNRRVVQSCFQCWKRYPEWLHEERQREARRDQLRRRVAEVIPDFRSSAPDSPW